MKRIAFAALVIVAAFGLVACGGGGSSSSTSSSSAATTNANPIATSNPVGESEEQCEFFAEEARAARGEEKGGWEITLHGCEEELKDAEEPARVAREERENQLRLNASRRRHREEREALHQAAIRRARRKVATTKREEIEILKELCSASVSEAVAEEERTGRYLREYWRECH